MTAKTSPSNVAQAAPPQRKKAGDGAAPKQRGVVTRPVPAASRVIAILRLLGRSDTPLGVHAVANALGLIPSTCLHILRVLVAEELVAFDPETKRYALSAGILSIAGGVLRRRSFSDLAQPALDDMSRKWNATAIGVEAAGLRHMVVVAISRYEQGLRLHTDIGSRFPALISATGRCLAAFGNHADEEVDRRFATLRWDNPPSLEEWRSEVEEVRRKGYAVDEGRYISGVTTIAAPVSFAAGASKVLVLVGLSDQLRRFGHEAIGEDLRRHAARISEQVKELGR